MKIPLGGAQVCGKVGRCDVHDSFIREKPGGTNFLQGEARVAGRARLLKVSWRLLSLGRWQGMLASGEAKRANGNVAKANACSGLRGGGRVPREGADGARGGLSAAGGRERGGRAGGLAQRGRGAASGRGASQRAGCGRAHAVLLCFWRWKPIAQLESSSGGLVDTGIEE